MVIVIWSSLPYIDFNWKCHLISTQRWLEWLVEMIELNVNHVIHLIWSCIEPQLQKGIVVTASELVLNSEWWTQKNSRKAWWQERYIQSQVNILTKVQDSKKFCFVSWTCLCFFYWNTDLFTCDCDILVFYVHILAFFNHRYRLWLKHLFPSLRVCFLSSTS